MKKLITLILVLLMAVPLYAADTAIDSFTDDSGSPVSTDYLIGYSGANGYRWTIASLLGLAGWAATPAASCVLGFTGGGAWGCKTTLNIVLDNSAPQVKDATDATKLLKLDPVGMTTGKTLTAKYTFDQSATFETKNTGLSADSKTITVDYACTDDCTLTTPAATATLASLAGTETFTNKTLTTPYSTLPTVDGGASDLVLSVAQVSGTVISNTGQGVANRNHTLPQAAAGYNFIGFVGEAQGSNYY